MVKVAYINSNGEIFEREEQHEFKTIIKNNSFRIPLGSFEPYAKIINGYYPDRIEIAFFNIICLISNKEYIQAICNAKDLILPIDYEIDSSETGKVTKHLSTFILESMENTHINIEVCDVDNMVNSFLEANDKNERWKILEKTLTYIIYNKMDLLNIIPNYAIIWNPINFIFQSTPNDCIAEQFMFAKILEKYIKYKTLSLNNHAKNAKQLHIVRARIPKGLKFIFSHRMHGVSLNDIDQECIDEMKHFITTGYFRNFPNVQSSIIPYSNSPHDGLLFRFIFILILFGFSKELPDCKSRNLKVNVPHLVIDMFKPFDTINQIIELQNFKPDLILSCETTSQIYEPIIQNLQLFQNVFQSQCILDLFDYIKTKYVA